MRILLLTALLSLGACVTPSGTTIKGECRATNATVSLGGLPWDLFICDEAQLVILRPRLPEPEPEAAPTPPAPPLLKTAL